MKKDIFFILILIFFSSINYAHQLCKNCQSHIYSEFNRDAPYMLLDELCTEVGMMIKNLKSEICEDKVRFFLDGKFLECDNQNKNISLMQNESRWVTCKNKKLKNFCENVHSLRADFCGFSFNRKIGLPNAKILSPNNGDTFLEGSTILFLGLVDEGIKTLNEYEYEWSSDLDGIISNEQIFLYNALSVGEHEITFRVKTDDSKASNIETTEKIKIKIDPRGRYRELEVKESKTEEKFRAVILAPLDNGTYSQENEIKFTAFVVSGKEPYKFEWTSSVDGLLGKEKNFSKFLSSGIHEISLKSEDALGAVSSDRITINVVTTPLDIVIKSPKDGEIFLEGSQIPLEYEIKGGKKPFSITWMLNGEKIGGIYNISPGSHEITLIVEDYEGDIKEKEVHVYVKKICNKDGKCSGRENFLNCPEDCNSGSNDNYCDSVKDGKCDIDCIREDDEDCFCNHDGICEIKFENFLNCPNDCPSGLKDNYCDRVYDDICDPDCLTINETDPDCKNMYEKYLTLILVIIFFIALYFIVKKILIERRI